MKQQWLLLMLLLALAGCNLDAPSTVVVNRQTVAALTPEPTATLPPTPTLRPSTTPTRAPTATAGPTATPAGESATLVDSSYCRREFGSANGTRFRGRLSAVRTTLVDQYEQVILAFDELDGTLHGSATCALAAAWPEINDYGSFEAPGPAFIGLQLDNWAHDDLFESSALTQTIELTTGTTLQRVAFAADALASRGALVGIGLDEPRPFRIRVQQNELIVEVVRNVAFPPPDDPLGQPEGDVDAPTTPLFFLHQGDVYRLEQGSPQPILRTPELETGLAVSPDGTTLAVCRAPADTEPFALPYEARATLWTMRTDGSEAQQLADVGGCAEPAFAASSRTIAFVANVAPTPPALLQVWTVPVVGGDASPVVSTLDEWSRSQPHWLPDGRLVYRAVNDAGQSVLFVRDDEETEREVTAKLLTNSAYRGVGHFVVDTEQGQLALEALRSADDGADLVILRPDGTQVAAEKRGFWQRPLGFSDAGLFYLTAECPSESVLRYTLHRRSGQGSINNILEGSTGASIGDAALHDDTLVYVRASSQLAGLRGPQAPSELEGASSLWRMSADGEQRVELFAADTAIDGLAAVSQP